MNHPPDLILLTHEFQDLLPELNAFYECHKHEQKYSQLSLMYSAAAEEQERITDSVGWAKDEQMYLELLPEAEFIKPILAYIQESGRRACRARIMTLEPKTCLSYHRDTTMWRYHIPMKTSWDSFFLVDDEVRRMPQEGALYKLNTSLMHTAVNAHKTERRSHLVVSVW
jgi:hypothetical protein